MEHRGFPCAIIHTNPICFGRLVSRIQTWMDRKTPRVGCGRMTNSFGDVPEE